MVILKWDVSGEHGIQLSISYSQKPLEDWGAQLLLYAEV